MAIFTTSTGKAIGQALIEDGLFIAWGTGDPAWDTVPVQIPSDQEQLVAEIGRRRCALVEFVDPTDDIAGPILVQGQHYTVAEVPSRYLHIKASFDNADGAGQSVRESAVFVGCSLNGGLPGGRTYFTPGDVAENGLMLVIDRFLALERTVDFRDDIEFVLTL